MSDEAPKAVPQQGEPGTVALDVASKTPLPGTYVAPKASAAGEPVCAVALNETLCPLAIDAVTVTDAAAWRAGTSCHAPRSFLPP